MNIEWKSGAPKEEGFYWFDNGLRIGRWDNPKPILLVMTRGSDGLYGHVEGAGGSCPLNMIYNEKRHGNAIHTKVIPPGEKWKDFSCLSRGTRAWVKHREKKAYRFYVGYIW